MTAAGPGGEHEGTLLLVWGDHGQTGGGDHGGGTPAEVDSALVAVDLAALDRLRRGGRAAAGSTVADAVAPGSERTKTAAAVAKAVVAAGAGQQASAASEGSCSAGDTGGAQQCDASRQRVGRIEAERLRQRGANVAPQTFIEGARRGGRHAMWRELPQVDYAPTVAAMLGLPTPYGSIGRVSPHLWAMRGCAGGAGGGGCAAEYADVLRRNAWQVPLICQAITAVEHVNHTCCAGNLGASHRSLCTRNVVN